MIFLAPLALIALATLPAFFLLLRLAPPAPSRIRFPPAALLLNLPAAETTASRLPIWLFILRLVAVTLLVLGFAGPSLNPPQKLPGTGPILLVIDNGWASVAHWSQTLQTAENILSAAGTERRAIAILATAPALSGAPPQLPAMSDAVSAAQLLRALQPEPWPADRREWVGILGTSTAATRIYLADGITDGPGFGDFIAALRPAAVYAASGAPPLLLPPTIDAAGNITVHLAGGADPAVLLAQDANGRVLARTAFDRSDNATLRLPPLMLSNVAKLMLSGPVTAGGTAYMADGLHQTSIGISAGATGGASPFTGTLFFLSRALPAPANMTTGSFEQLVAAAPSVIILADVPLNAAQQRQARSFISNGGILIRFAGPLTAAAPDELAAGPLLPGDRRLGGTLTWSAPQHLSAFPANSPFAGLTLDPSVTVTQQILADPAEINSQTLWAGLTDGTPLILGKASGKGYLISVLTSANTAWTNLPLSGLFPQLLARLTMLAEGTPIGRDRLQPLLLAMDAYGDLSKPLVPATAYLNSATTISPAMPPGLYGNAQNTFAVNIGGHVPPLMPARLPHAMALGSEPAIRDLGPSLIAAAALLFALDLLVSLKIRGLMPRFAFALLLAGLLPLQARAQSAALQPELGYITTNNPTTDQTTADALAFLSSNTSAHTSVQLGPPAALMPGRDDLSLYPLIYWRLLASIPAPSPAACAALGDYMAHGGLLVIDMPGSDAGGAGSGAGFYPGAADTFSQDTACLNLPPLEPLTAGNVLAHSFYIVPDFPGRFTGAPVLIAIAAARDADGVTPVIVSQNDWAAAWARDAAGTPEQKPIPGAETQRLIADRFGINLVIYALTGSYKSDQNTAPDILDKLGP